MLACGRVPKTVRFDAGLTFDFLSEKKRRRKKKNDEQIYYSALLAQQNQTNNHGHCECTLDSRSEERTSNASTWACTKKLIALIAAKETATVEKRMTSKALILSIS